MAIVSTSPWSSIRFKSWTTVWAGASGCIWSHLCAILYSAQGDRFREGFFVGGDRRWIESQSDRIKN
jgi:hypothetical protein